MYKLINKNITFGVHTAIEAGKTSVVPRVLNTCVTNKKVKVRNMPIPKCTPVPPRDLRDEMATASKVNTKKEKGVATRL